MSTRSIMLIDRGDLPSLAALAIQPDAQTLILWHQHETDAAADRRLAVVREHAEMLSARRLIVSPAPMLGLAELTPPKGLATTQMLLRAALAAGALGCDRVIWPAHAGLDPGAITCEVDRADAVAALTEIDGDGAPAVTFDLPVVDFSDEHLVDIVEDCGLPLNAFWPGATAGPMPEADSPSVNRWKEAFLAAGQPWPWPATSAERTMALAEAS